MKNIKTLLIILTAALFFVACQKDEAPLNYNSISGQLTAGENVTADELKGLHLALAKFKSDGDIHNTSLDTETFDFKDMVMLDELGAFEFIGHEPGNYFISLNEFIFTTDTVYRFRFDGTEALNIQQTIIRNPADNFLSPYPPCTSKYANVDMKNYSGPELTLIRAYGYYIGNGQPATKDVVFENIDGIITIYCLGNRTPICVNDDAFQETHFVFGFADGNGGTVYSEKFEFKPGYDSCEGLPQTIGQITISCMPTTLNVTANYALTNN